MDEQLQIKNWFDQTYQQRGFGYLRPSAAYTIYTQLLNLQPGENFLDVACGPGLMLQQAVAVGCQAHGVDLSDVAIGMAQDFVPQAITQTANAQALPFADGTMDAVTCLGSLERMIDLDKVLQEIQRVSTVNARFCFLVRNSGNFTWQLFMEHWGLRNKTGHQGAKTLVEWTAVFQHNNFQIDQILPDQWPFVRWGQALTLGLYQPNPTTVRHGIKPLRYAYEFVFLLRKRKMGRREAQRSRDTQRMD